VRRLIVEADGGSRGNPGPAAYGTVVRDADTEEVLVERAEYIGRASNNVAEYHGLIAGLLAVAEIDPVAQVEARLDSKLVVEQMSGRWKIKHPDMRPLALQARAILSPTQVTYTWVPREDNKHADRLANEALDAAARGEDWKLGLSPSEVRAARAPTAAARQVVDEAELEPPPRNALAGWAPDLGEPTTFVLLRHGETDYTKDRRFSGSGGADVGLSEVGRAQVAAAAEALGRQPQRWPVEAVVSSPLRRARETAEAVSDVLGITLREVDGLRECAFGKWDGFTLGQVRERWPAEFGEWLGSTAVPPPGGESYDEVWRRVRVARDQILTRYAGQTVLVVSHVTPVKVHVGLALGAATDALFRMELQPASLSEIQWYPGGPTCLRLFNDTAHLSGLS
jgi:probable phosphoglycerate mutase